MKPHVLIVALALIGLPLSAQHVSILSTDYPANSLTILNAKPAMTKAAGAPSSNCTQGLDLYLNTTNGNVYACSATNTWALVTGSGAGTVTSVGFTGGLISVGTPTSTPAFTVAGTSGGIPYFSGAAAWASSAALTANLPVLGGGAGAAPIVGTRSGNTTAYVTTTGTQTNGDCVKIDASGNHVANGAACGSGGSGLVTWKLDGSTIGSPRATLRIINSTGMAWTGADTGTQVEYTAIVDTATIQSRATAQAGTSTYCRSTTGNDTYTCSLTPALAAYTRGGCVLLDADTANTLTANINVSTLGAKSILGRAGAALATGDITANKPITVCYDGTQYIIQGDGGGGGGGSGTVTSVGFTGGLVSVANPTTTPAFTVAGTSGGIPYFSAASTWASSGALAQYGVVLGGGAGAAPTATAVGTSGQVLTSNGAGVAPTFQAVAGGTGNGYTMQFNNPGYGAASMANSTAYYFGYYNGYGTFNQIETQYYKVYMTVPKTGTITAVTVDEINENTLPSSESVSYYIYKNNAPGITLSTGINWSTGINVSSTFTGLSLAVTAGDTIAFRVLTPVWTTPPGALGVRGSIYID